MYYSGDALIQQDITFPDDWGGYATVYAQYIYEQGGLAYVNIESDTGDYHYGLYKVLRNAQGDIVSITNAAGYGYDYEYSAYGELSGDSIFKFAPFAYRGYYYDADLGMYNLGTRYYDPEIGRFFNADNVIAGVGSSTQGYNMFSYCFNNPVNMSDPSGNWPIWDSIKNGFKKATKWVNDNIIQPVINYVSDNYVKHDVPLYDQGKTSLCWAYCQMMVEDYQSGTTSTKSEVDNRAKQLAIQENGSDNWNSGDWPTNLGEKINASQITDIKVLHGALQQGPLYAYYDDPQVKGGAHLVVVTGVNCFTGKVYTNNPHGIFGKQSFDEFLNMYAGGDDSAPLFYVYTIM